ncbi:MAG TPA: hypothetical protein VGT61_07455 [Thermomicrobiales bacterium]|jgi:hypothetical protein|nr:hypothetical protein [Thermomicrobiales bacterium]
MSDQYTTSAADHIVGAPRVSTGVHGDHVETDTIAAKNRVQWGPIIAGVLTAIATLLILTVLGLAIGSTALEPREVGESLGTVAAIWGAISAIIAFFVGGYVAAKTAAVGGTGSGMINGLMVGVTILAIVLYLTGTGVSSLIGTLGSNIGDLTNIAQQQGVSTTDPAAAAQQQASQVDPQAAFDTVQDSAWGTLAGLILPLIAAALGGMLGHNRRRDLVGTA